MAEERRNWRVPRGWPGAVSPPGTQEWEATAAAWLRDLLPECRNHPTVQQQPVALAFIARHVLAGAVDGARQGYRSTRRELGPLVPAAVTAAILSDFRNEGQRLSANLRAVELVEHALRGKRDTSGNPVPWSRGSADFTSALDTLVSVHFRASTTAMV